MKNRTFTTAREATALERFTLISRIEDALRRSVPLRRALEEAAATPLRTQSGERFFKIRTIEDWWYAYQRGGFPALQPKERSDRGQSRTLTTDQQQYVLQQVQTHLAIPVKILYRRWIKVDPTLPSLNSIYRWLRHNELHAKGRHTQLHQSLSGPTKAFETPLSNDLWMVDFSPGPFLRPLSGKAFPTQLCLIVDDHSRLVPFAAYHRNADASAFHQTLKEAIRRRGLPQKLYTDQGRVFTSDHTRIICANLGIRLLHAKPYHAWSKGKVERLFHTLQQQFEKSLRLPGEAAFTLEQLNDKFSCWLQSDYHPRVHSSTGQSPEERFAKDNHLIRLLDPHLDLDRLFYHRLVRTVRKDGTIRLDSQLYEVDLALRHLQIEVQFDPYKRDRLEVYHKSQSFGLALPVDLNLNSQLKGNYENR